MLVHLRMAAVDGLSVVVCRNEPTPRPPSLWEGEIMVRLSKIYTKTGDDGTTGLGDGSRVAKTDLPLRRMARWMRRTRRWECCVIEGRKSDSGAYGPAIAKLLTIVQNDLFDVGADLCCPIGNGEKPGERLRVTSEQSQRLERAIDEHNERLRPLDSFVLPGAHRWRPRLHVSADG